MPSAPAGTALADHHRDDRRPQHHHFAQVDRDGLGDMPFFRADARIRARRVDQRHHRQPEFLRQTHDSHRLAITLGMGAAEVALDVLLHVAPFLVGDDDAANPVQRGQTARHGAVIAEGAVPVQFDEVAEAQPQVIQGVGSLWMARDFHTIPGAEIGVNLSFGLGQVRGDAADLRVEIDLLPVQMALEFIQLFFEFENRLFKVEGRDVHGRAETN